MINLVISMFLLFFSQNESVVEKLQDKFTGVKTLTADFYQNSSSGSSIKGKFYFKKDNCYRIELDNNQIISDGVTIWNKDLKRLKVVISNLEDDPLAFSLPDYIYNFPSKCRVKEESVEKGFLIELVSKNPLLNFRSAKLWINENYNIEKIRVYDFGGNYFTFEFKNIVINESLSDNLFRYSDSSEDKIIDLR